MATATIPTVTVNPAVEAAFTQATEAFVNALNQTAALAGDVVTRTGEALAPVAQDAQARAKEIAETYAAENKKVAGLSVDNYEEAVKDRVAKGIEIAEATKVDWVAELARNNAKVVTEVVEASVTAARDLLK